MALRYPAELEIDGRIIAGTWDGSDTLAAVDNFSIQWGRSDHYSATPPATLTCSIIDPTGWWGTESALAGKPVIIRRKNPDRIVFRGRIGESSTRPVNVSHPKTQRPSRVWRVDFTAGDVLADLAQAILPGVPDSSVPADAGWGPKAWPRDNFIEHRIAQLLSQGANALVGDITVPALVSVGFQAGASLADQLSVLDFIERAYAAGGLTHVNYNTDIHTVEVGRTIATVGVALALAAGKIVIQPTAGVTVPASRIQLGGEPALRSPVQAAVDSVQVSYVDVVDRSTATVDNPGSSIRRIQRLTVERLTSAFNPAARGRRVLLSDAMLATTSVPNGSEPASVVSLAETIAANVSALNGRFYLPPLVFDFERFDHGNAIADLLLKPMSSRTQFVFPGSMFNGLPNVGPSFQNIGGVISYSDGWKSQVNFAPTTGAPADSLTVAGLVTNTTPTFNDYDPDITLNDFATVTIGLS